VLAGGIFERTSGAAGQPLRGGYQRREPEQTVLHELVSRHAQTMLAELRDADGRGLPRYVERELAEYLRCGILAHGFARVRCTTCHEEITELLGEAATAGLVRNDIAAAELAVYCVHAISAAAGLPSKAAVQRLVSVTLSGPTPGSARHRDPARKRRSRKPA
jgi:hypothetical protein